MPFSMAQSTEYFNRPSTILYFDCSQAACSEPSKLYHSKVRSRSLVLETAGDWWSASSPSEKRPTAYTHENSPEVSDNPDYLSSLSHRASNTRARSFEIFNTTRKQTVTVRIPIHITTYIEAYPTQCLERPHERLIRPLALCPTLSQSTTIRTNINLIISRQQMASQPAKRYGRTGREPL